MAFQIPGVYQHISIWALKKPVSGTHFYEPVSFHFCFVYDIVNDLGDGFNSVNKSNHLAAGQHTIVRITIHISRFCALA